MNSESHKQIFIDVSKLKINPEYEKLIPRMNSEDEKSFDESVKENKIRESIIVNQNNIVLDGHSRYRKALKYKIKLVPYEIREFTDKLQEKKYVIETNLQRRHLNSFQKVELGFPLIEIESQIAKKRQKEEGAKHGRGIKKTLASSDAKVLKGKTVEIVSKKIKVPASTIERAKAIIEKAPKELQEKVRTGKTSINSAYQQITKKERSLPTVKLPKGEFDVILCDVPIAFNDKGGRGAAENHYPTMTPQELAKLKIPSSKNAIIFFWMSPSIQYSIVDSSEVDRYSIYQYILDAWDFQIVKGEFVWDKEIIGLGSWNRNQHENCLIAIKGKMPCPAELFSSIIKEKRTKHSRKPEIFYSMIEKMFPKRNYLELFGRTKRNGWTVYGNEVNENIPPKQTTSQEKKS